MTKFLLVETELKKLEKSDAAYFRGKNYFAGNDGTQNCLAFQPMYKYFKTNNNVDNISEWKFKGLSSVSIKTPSTSNNSLNLLLTYINTKIRIKFSGICLKQDKATHDARTIVDIYIV